jgi:hypothetical protein
MMSQREILFRTKSPSEIAPKDVANLLREHGEVVSFAGREGPEDLLQLVFVSAKDTAVGPICLNPVVARELCKFLVGLGYASEHTPQAPS